MSVNIADMMRRAANDARIGFLLDELHAYGVGWITLTGGEVRAYREELDRRLENARGYGCDGQHVYAPVGLANDYACATMRRKAARS